VFENKGLFARQRQGLTPDGKRLRAQRVPLPSSPAHLHAPLRAFAPRRLWGRKVEVARRLQAQRLALRSADLPRVPCSALPLHLGNFRGGLVFKARRLLYSSTLGLRVITKKKRSTTSPQRGIKSSLSIAFIRTTSRRILAGASINQGTEKGDSILL